MWNFTGVSSSDSARNQSSLSLMHTSTVLENLKGALGNQVENVLRMFEKFINGYDIQISTV